MIQRTINGLELPRQLCQLLISGWWPRTEAEALRQNLTPLVSRECVKRLCADQEEIYFFPPPFVTLSESLKSDQDFWSSSIASIDKISQDRAIDIGDFGSGSDSPILLHYGENSSKPEVLFLEYNQDYSEAHWVRCASSFGEFLQILGIPCALSRESPVQVEQRRTLAKYSFGRMTIGGRSYQRDLIILANGKVISPWLRHQGHELSPKDIRPILESRPSVLVIGTGRDGRMVPSQDLCPVLRQNGIEPLVLPTPQAVQQYNQLLQENTSVSACFHLTC